MLATMIGCSSSDDRLIELSHSKASPAKPSRTKQMARQSQQVAEASKQLVQADAQARQELIAAQTQLQEGLQTERGSLDRQHEDLEAERKQIAAQRHRDPIVAAAIMHIGVLLACLLPLVVCIYLLRTLKDSEPEGELCNLLVEELVSPEPKFLPLLTPPVQPAEPEALPELPSDDAA